MLNVQYKKIQINFFSHFKIVIEISKNDFRHLRRPGEFASKTLNIALNIKLQKYT